MQWWKIILFSTVLHAKTSTTIFTDKPVYNAQTTILLMMNWTCQQLLCNASAMQALLNLILPYVAAMCAIEPSVASTISTAAQCTEYTMLNQARQQDMPSFSWPL
jgi:hypothetical protein